MNLGFLKSLLPSPFVRDVQASLFKRLDLAHVLESDIRVEVLSRTDWGLYNDIFVDGEYDEAIKAMLRRTEVGQRILVIDAGANVGFFNLRLFQLLSAAGCPATSVHVVAVEPSRANVRELRRRLSMQGRWADCVTILPGLVGEKRSGEAVLFESHNYGMNTLIGKMRYRGAKRTAATYVDLDRDVPSSEPIHLLKCDIEGAEFPFVENYAGLMGRVEVAIFEIHHGAGSVEQLKETLKRVGLSEERVIAERGDTSVRMYTRRIKSISAP
jgi:FkbM family methyltransferase